MHELVITIGQVLLSLDETHLKASSQVLSDHLSQRIFRKDHLLVNLWLELLSLIAHPFNHFFPKDRQAFLLPHVRLGVPSNGLSIGDRWEAALVSHLIYIVRVYGLVGLELNLMQ